MAVYTHIQEAQLRQWLASFDIGALHSFSGIASGIENTNYLLQTERGKFILTLFEKRTKAEDLPFYAALMSHLHKKGIPCPEMIGAPGLLAGKPACVTSFLSGAEAQAPSATQIHAAAKMLAQMHVAAKDFPMTRGNAMELLAWRRLIEACGAQEELQKELRWHETHPLPDLPKGVIHADFFPDNVFFEGDALSGVIDFYFACTDHYAYDFMLAGNAWCGKDLKKWQALQAGYESRRPLEKAERESLPILGRRAALRIIATRLYDRAHPATDALVTPKDPAPYLEILKFHQASGFAA